ncbi:MAG TPA: STAS domain-containing protein [Gemmataceae bacterium]|jgi:anti-anti-sigma factor|nr:STAS domain-containing protein [Gemmataceae bacterium]
MPAPSARHYFEWDEVDDVTVLRFTVPSIREDKVIGSAFEEVNQVVEAGRTRLVLDFGAVQDFASLTIGKLIALHKRLQPPAGRLALCNLTPVVAEALAIMNLDRHFHLYKTQEEALRSF